MVEGHFNCIFIYTCYIDIAFSHHIFSIHIISYHVMSYHIISFHFMSYHIISCHIIHIISYHTSSTAQGGGGSFKNRKPIGEVGCCESGMAERSR